MVGETLIELMRNSARDAIPDASRTDLVYGVVISTDPLRVQVGNETHMLLGEELLIRSPMSFGVSVGDHVAMLRVKGGNAFYVLHKTPAAAAGMLEYAFYVNDDGDLIVRYVVETGVPEFYINAAGELVRVL